MTPEQSPEARARTLVAQLEMVSHAPAMNLDSGAKSSEHPGGKRPPGGPCRKDDMEPGYAQKSHLYFRRWLSRCHTDGQFLALIAAAEEALDRWKRTPLAPKDSIAWRDQIVSDTRKASVIAKQYGITRQYVWQIKNAAKNKAA